MLMILIHVLQELIDNLIPLQNEFISKIHPKRKFTLELEQDSNINFPDLTIKNSNDQHDFARFNKPSHTDIISHNSCVHQYQHTLLINFS